MPNRERAVRLTATFGWEGPNRKQTIAAAESCRIFAMYGRGSYIAGTHSKVIAHSKHVEAKGVLAMQGTCGGHITGSLAKSSPRPFAEG